MNPTAARRRCSVSDSGAESAEPPRPCRRPLSSRPDQSPCWYFAETQDNESRNAARATPGPGHPCATVLEPRCLSLLLVTATLEYSTRHTGSSSPRPLECRNGPRHQGHEKRALLVKWAAATWAYASARAAFKFAAASREQFYTQAATGSAMPDRICKSDQGIKETGR